MYSHLSHVLLIRYDIWCMLYTVLHCEDAYFCILGLLLFFKGKLSSRSLLGLLDSVKSLSAEDSYFHLTLAIDVAIKVIARLFTHRSGSHL